MKLLTILDYLDLRRKIPKIDCMQRKRSHVKLIAPRADVTPFPVVVTQSDYDAVPVGGLYWFNCQLQKRYWAAQHLPLRPQSPLSSCPQRER